MNHNRPAAIGLGSRFFSTLLDQLPSHIFWKNTAGVYLGCNNAFIQSLGLSSASEVIGKTDYDLPVSKTVSALYCKDDQRILQCQEFMINIEEEQVFPDGRREFLLTSKVPLYENDQVVGILGIYSNITELKRTQLALRIAKEKAESAHIAKNKFIENMSHDMRTPITGMLGIIYAWKKRADTCQDREDAELLEGCTNELLKLCNEVLDLLQLESNMSNKKVVVFRLSELLESKIILLRAAAKNRKIEMHTHYDENIPDRYVGQKIAVDAIFLNLISNAIKFTQKGRVDVFVSVEQKEEDIKLLKVIIADTGIGIPEDKLQYIFEKFTRLTESYSGIYKGSGLGLYMVHQWVQALKGDISVQSQLGCGSQFTVRIPLKVIPEIDKQKILLIEDNSVISDYIVSMLNTLGCEVEIACSGQEALQSVSVNYYLLIFIDLFLKDMTSFEFTKNVRDISDSVRSATPIIALTDCVTEHEKEKILGSGISAVLEKPLTPAIAQLVVSKYKTCK